jgi:hypothetical protein
LISISALAMAAQPLGSLKTTENVTLSPDGALGVKDTIEGGELAGGFCGTVADAGQSVLLPAYWAVT